MPQPPELIRPTSSPAALPLEEVLDNGRLTHPSRLPDYRREAEGFITLSHHLAQSPADILNALCKTAMEMVGAGSAGISIAETVNGEALFRWYALAGRMAPLLGATMPRHSSPSGLVLDTGKPQLMLDLPRHYQYVQKIKVPISELLVVPLRVDNVVVGTLWAVHHESQKKFDSEDVRLLTSLSVFAAVAYQNHLRLKRQSESDGVLAFQRLKLQSIFDISAIGLALVRGEDLIFEKVNAEFEALVSPREYVGRKWSDVYFEILDSPLLGIMARVLETGIPYAARETKIDVLTENGRLESRWYDITYARVTDDEDKSYGVLIQTLNVTRQVVIRREQDQKDQIVQESRQEAERANSAKSAFLANMSHEIRTPLGAIMGFSDMLKTPGLTKDETLSYVAIIDRNSRHLLRVVDDILDLSKVEAGKMLIEEIDFSLPELLAEFSSLMSMRAKEKGIEFELRIPTLIPARVISDPTRLRQILNNVVGNAIKFTEQGRVQMSVTFAGPRLEFSVSDTGHGISPENSEKLFQPFEQGDVSTTRKFGGTGLGLVLTRRLAELLGGTFQLIKSAVGRGSVFVATIEVKVPLDTAMVPSKGQEFVLRTSSGTFEDGDDLKGMRLLVVEDSTDNQELFQLYLSRVGASVDLASDGFEGVNLALTNDYDAILMDVQMPRMDGHQATRSLRHRNYEGPIIALTAHAMKEERERAIASGFTDFLSKPVQRNALVEMLTKYKKAPSFLPVRAPMDRLPINPA